MLFDRETWKTHILTPSAAMVYEAILTHGNCGSICKAEIIKLLEDDFGFDTDTTEIRRLLSMLKNLGLLH